MNPESALRKTAIPADRPAPTRAASTQEDAQAVRLAVSSRRSATAVRCAAAVVGIVIGALGMRAWNHRPDVMAAVNGVPIDRLQFDKRMEFDSGHDVLSRMISNEIELEYAKTHHSQPSQADVARQFNKVSDRPDFNRLLEGTGERAADFLNDIVLKLSLTRALTRGIDVSNGEVRTYYRAQADPHNPNALFYAPATTTVEVIVTPSQDRALDAVARIHAGVPFEAVARAYSIDASRVAGGVMPTAEYGRSNLSRVPAMEKAVFGLKVGEVMGPRMYLDEWWIFKCLDRTPSRVQPFDAVEYDCRLGALLQKGARLNGTQFQDELQAFYRKARVQAFWPQYRDLAPGAAAGG